MLIVGEKFGHYKIHSAIGAGGMGEIYRARDTRLRRDVAIKILPSQWTQDASAVERFMREAYAASALNHPNILTIYDIGEYDSIQFIATEFVDGKTLREQIKTAPLTLSESLDIAVQISSALVAAHSAGIVHRDIKSENIMIRNDGLVKILDFGIAKIRDEGGRMKDESEMDNQSIFIPHPSSLIPSEAATAIKANTSPGTIIGTANYMSPEQARGKTVDARSDIFSFGIVLYEMLSGKKPFAGETTIDTIGAILHKEPLPLNQILPDIPHEIERIINKTLKKERDERYQTAKDLLLDAYEKRNYRVTYIKVDPRFDSLRDDPRFQELLRKVGFPQ